LSVDPSKRADYPRLRHPHSGGYDKGRSIVWQAAWFATQNLAWSTWWFPRRLRPAVLRAFGAQLGSNVFIRHRVRILWPWKLEVGNDCLIGEDVWLLNLEPIVVGSDVCLSQGVFLCTGSHDHRSADFAYDNGPIEIQDGAWVAAQALVLRGVTVGVGCVVGARAVVRRDVLAGDNVPVNSVH
jgi:putative colanic acid biosynthesis acetyltransferase WcaF